MEDIILQYCGDMELLEEYQRMQTVLNARITQSDRGELRRLECSPHFSIMMPFMLQEHDYWASTNVGASQALINIIDDLYHIIHLRHQIWGCTPPSNPLRAIVRRSFYLRGILVAWKQRRSMCSHVCFFWDIYVQHCSAWYALIRNSLVKHLCCDFELSPAFTANYMPDISEFLLTLIS